MISYWYIFKKYISVNIQASFVRFHLRNELFRKSYTNVSVVSLGCKGAQVEEIWSMEPENFENLK